MHALVTGASAGIGEALARALAGAGYDLTLVARRQAELERLKASLDGRRVEAVPADLGELEKIDGLVARAAAALGPIDVLVNNAGIQIVARTEDVGLAESERLLTLNVLAPFRLTRAVLPDMLARGAGTIVDIASLSALAPTPGMFHYSASKAALAAASESLRAEVGRRGVHVVTVYPGPVKTAMADAALAKYDAGGPQNALPVGTVEELARRVMRAIARRQARVIYPRAYVAARMFPSLTRWAVDRFSPLPRKLEG
jgi:short-subunit dehydrogenase